jgi:thiosulfate/3-mercaptopyruvate sulfurtransferase
MEKASLVRSAPALVVAGLVAAASAAAAEKTPVLVSAQWLASHRTDPGLVILHVVTSDTAPKLLVPGARVLDTRAISAERGGIPVEMRPVAEIVEAFETAGVSNDKHVVVYGEGPPYAAARVFVTLDYLGHGDRTSLLDGGLDAWKAAGQELAAQPAAAARGKFAAKPREDMLVSADSIAARLNDPKLVLIDARTAAEYTGERKIGPRGGHLPGAYHLYYQDLLLSQDEPRLKDVAYVKERFAESGATKDSAVVSYCQVGMRASYTYVISRHLGYDAKLYDPSWAEWASRQDLPVTQGSSRR